MPGKKTLQNTFEMKVPGSRKFGKYKFWLEWEGRRLYYKHVVWKKIDLAETLGWDVGQAKEQPSAMAAQAEAKRVVFLKVWSRRYKKAVTPALKIPDDIFDTWLYWLLVSIQKHADIPILDEKLNRSNLAPGRKGKIKARRDMKAFDTIHSVFIQAGGSLEKGATQKGRMTTRRFQGKKPAPVEETGEGGIRFGKVIEHLGSGTQANVFKINRLRPTGRIEPAVVKSGGSTALVKEARVLAALGEHPNIIRLIDAHVIKPGRGFGEYQVRLFMELAEEGDLEKFVLKRQKAGKRLSPIQINLIALGMLSGLCHMHRRRIYHFDFKPQNVLMFAHYRPKIMDFGLSKTKLFEPGKKIYDIAVGQTGTLGYVPPEGFVYPCRLSKGIHLEKWDSYSAGITVFRMLIGPRYGWGYKRKDAKKEFSERDTRREIAYWSGKYEQHQKQLDKVGLLMLSHVAWMMIQKTQTHRVSVQEAFDALQGALKSRKSGRIALDAFGKWND